MKIEFSEFVLTSNPGTIILIKCTDLVVVGFKLVLLMDAKNTRKFVIHYWRICIIFYYLVKNIVLAFFNFLIRHQYLIFKEAIESVNLVWFTFVL